MTTVVHRPLSAFLTIPILGAFVVFALCTGRFVPFAAFLASLAACCLAYAWLSRFGVSLDIQAPTRATEGDTVDLSLLLDNRRWALPKFVSSSAAEVIAPVDSAAGSQFRRRHHGLFYWRAGGGDRPARRPPPAAHAADGAYEMDGFILWRGRCRIHREIAVPHRGVLRFRSLKLFFSDPLGIFALRRTWRLNHEILVRIKPTAGAPRLDLIGSCGRIETQKRIGESADANEYAGTRPYRPGDELRHLHWPTVARTGELHVREYTPSSADTVVALLLRAETDGQATAGAPPAAEAMLRTLVALVIELFSRRIMVYFGTNIGAGQALEIGYSQRNLQDFHDHISRLSWTTTTTDGSHFADRLHIAGVDRPLAIVFCLEAVAPATLNQIATTLRLERRQMIMVIPRPACPSDQPPPAFRQGRLVLFDAEAPEALFAHLTR